MWICVYIIVFFTGWLCALITVHGKLLGMPSWHSRFLVEFVLVVIALIFGYLFGVDFNACP